MTSASISLRPYRGGDLVEIFRLDQLCFSEVFRFDRDSMRRFAEARHGATIVAESEADGVVGFVIAHQKRCVAVAGTVGYILTIDVAEQHRRSGLARRLLEEVERRMAAAGAAWLELHVHMGNGAAIAFYERMGYEREARCGGFYGPGVDAWLYRKPVAVVD